MYNIAPLTPVSPPAHANTSSSSPPATVKEDAASMLGAWSTELLDQQRALAQLHARIKQPAGSTQRDLPARQRQKKKLLRLHQQASTNLKEAQCAVDRNLANVERTEQKLGKKLRALEELADSCHHPLPTSSVEDLLRRFPALRTTAPHIAPNLPATIAQPAPPLLAQLALSPEELQRIDQRREAIDMLETEIRHTMQLEQATRNQLVKQVRFFAALAEAPTARNAQQCAVARQHLIRTVTDQTFQLDSISRLLAALEIITPPEQAQHDSPVLFDKLLALTAEFHQSGSGTREALFKEPANLSFERAAYNQFTYLVTLLGLSKTNKPFYELIQNTAKAAGDLIVKYPVTYKPDRDVNKTLTSASQFRHLHNEAALVIQKLAAQVDMLKAKADDAVHRKAKLRLSQTGGESRQIKGEQLAQLQMQYTVLSGLLRNNARKLVTGASFAMREHYLDDVLRADLTHEQNEQKIALQAQLRPDITSNLGGVTSLGRKLRELEQLRDELLTEQREATRLVPALDVPGSSGKIVDGSIAPAATARSSLPPTDADSRRARLLGDMVTILEQNKQSTDAHATAAANWTSNHALLLRTEEEIAIVDASLDQMDRQSRAELRDSQQTRQRQLAEIALLESALAQVTSANLRDDPRVTRVISRPALTTLLERHLARSEAQLRARFQDTGPAASYASAGALLRALADVWKDAQRRMPELLAAVSEADFEQRSQALQREPRDLLCRHDDVLGHGINSSSGRPVDAFISCYSVDWDRAGGKAAVSHLYPSIPRR